MRIVADRPLTRVVVVASVAPVLAALGLAVDVALGGTGWVRPTTSVAALIAWGLTLVLWWRLRAALLRADDVHASLFAAHPQPIVLTDSVTLDVVAVNPAASAKYGYGEDEFATLSVLDLYRPEDRPGVRSAWTGLGERARIARRTGTHVARDGTAFAVELLSTTLLLDGRRIRMAVVNDVTDRDDARAGSVASDARYQQVVDTAKEGIVTIDPDQGVSVVNQSAADMLGYAVDERVRPGLAELSAVEVAAVPGQAGPPGTDEGVTGEREATLRRKDGTVVTVLLNESPLLDSEGAYAGQLGMMTDLTERQGFEDELAFRAAHDPLTGLPNRLLLIDRLDLALQRATPGEPGVAVVLLDIDGFKDVNTAHGHISGDLLLSEIAGRLTLSTRVLDTVARFGGDEFVVVSEGTGPFAELLVDRLRTALADPYVVGDANIDVTVSMGVAVGRHGDRGTALVRGADMALLQAKAGGRAGTEFFTEALRATSRQRLALVSDLRRAVDRGEFSLRFQPVVSLDDERIVGAEALIRWEHPQRGTLSPLEFIAVAEETGLIDPIGQWVIEETCRRFAGWQRIAPDLSMALNISARQLTAGVLHDILRDAVTESGADPSHLALEITEGVLMDDVDLAVDTLNALRKTGVTISVDDFGTGYSSLSYLDRFPIDVLKIDQSFVAGLPEDDYDIALVTAVLTIAGALDLAVVAEGVENSAQAATLLRLGCHQAQGYYFHRPLTAEAFEAELVAAR